MSPPGNRAALKFRLFVPLVLTLLLSGSCSEDAGETGEEAGSDRAGPARTEDASRTEDPPRPAYGYTYGQPSGNRFAEGEGRLPESRPVDVRLGGEPAWVVGVPMEEDVAWVVALKSGRLDAFRLDSETGTVEPWLVAPDELPAGTPPVVSEEDDLRLLVPPVRYPSELTHPVPLDGRLLGVAESGRLFVQPGGELPVLALPDARVTQSEGGTLAVLSDPTGRYAHGVLGDGLEAGSITVLEPGAVGPEVTGKVRPESGGVFELLAPMWFEAGGPHGGEELLAVTESTAEGGARISAYHPGGELAAAGPSFGEPGRWRHLLAAGPFGPGGDIEIAATRTPHVGGVIEFYRPNLEAGTLDLSATLPGYATHTIYSRNLDAALAGDLDGDGRWELLVPNQSYTQLAAVRRTESSAEVAWSLPVGNTLATNIASATNSSGRTSVAAGRVDGFLRVWP